MDRRTLAIVEDNEDNLALIEALLEDSFDLEIYRDGASALAGLPGGADLVLLDISLPAMSGEDVLRTLREREDTRGLKIVALTAHAMAGDRERFLAMGFDGYFSKPIVDEDALIALIGELLG